MSNLYILIFVFLILIFSSFIYKKLNNQLIKKIGFGTLIPSANEQKHNPDINTQNWDLHKNRLIKFGRSQYKGLTFFISNDDRIYYLSKEGNKVYC